MGAIIEFKRPEAAKPTSYAADEMFRYKLPDPKNELEAELFADLKAAYEEHRQAFSAYYGLNNLYRETVGMPRLGE